MIMNEHEVGEAYLFLHLNECDHLPNLRRASEVLDRLVSWTNANSDGWPYWAKPSNASRLLQGDLSAAVYAYRRDTLRQDVADADLTRALAPVKAFLTRQGVDADTKAYLLAECDDVWRLAEPERRVVAEPERRVVTVRSDGLRVAVGSPVETHAVVADLLATGYAPEQIEWED